MPALRNIVADKYPESQQLFNTTIGLPFYIDMPDDYLYKIFSILDQILVSGSNK
jgi:dTDP-4-amino-4,6-dideoxygalactose transaminase